LDMQLLKIRPETIGYQRLIANETHVLPMSVSYYDNELNILIVEVQLEDLENEGYTRESFKTRLDEMLLIASELYILP
jgi:hypothetical protein